MCNLLKVFLSSLECRISFEEYDLLMKNNSFKNGELHGRWYDAFERILTEVFGESSKDLDFNRCRVKKGEKLVASGKNTVTGILYSFRLVEGTPENGWVKVLVIVNQTQVTSKRTVAQIDAEIHSVKTKFERRMAKLNRERNGAVSRDSNRETSSLDIHSPGSTNSSRDQLAASSRQPKEKFSRNSAQPNYQVGNHASVSDGSATSDITSDININFIDFGITRTLSKHTDNSSSMSNCTAVLTNGSETISEETSISQPASSNPEENIAPATTSLDCDGDCPNSDEISDSSM